MQMQKHVRLQAGFTLIELIIVIVIIGIMAAVAIPTYTNLTQEARTGVLKGVAGAVSSAAATNYAIRAGGLTIGAAVGDCNAALALTTAPSEVTMQAAGSLTHGVTGTCTLVHSGGGTYAVSVIGSN